MTKEFSREPMPSKPHDCYCGMRCFGVSKRGKEYVKETCPDCLFCLRMSRWDPILTRGQRHESEFNGYTYNGKRSRTKKRNASINFKQRQYQVEGRRRFN